VLAPLNAIAGNFLLSMKDYPPSATPGSFNLAKIQQQIEASMAGK
jgi:arylsulfatase